MRMKNTTSLPKDFLKEVIRFSKPSGVSGFDIKFKNSRRGLKGRAYWGGTGWEFVAKDRLGRRNTPLITIGIGKGKRYPYLRAHGGGYLPVLLLSKEEGLVYIVAHELRHLWQAKHPKGWRVWGARGRFSERDACAYGIRKVREWRRQKREEVFLLPFFLSCNLII